MPAKSDEIYNRNGTYYYRVRVPKPLQSIMNRLEFQGSLKTSNQREAFSKSEPIIRECHNRIAIAQHAVNLNQPFHDADVKDPDEPVTQALVQALDELRTRFTVAPPLLNDPTIDAKHTLEYLASGEADLTNEFRRWCANRGIHISPKSQLWDTLYATALVIFKRGIDRTVTIHRDRLISKLSVMDSHDFIEHVTPAAPRAVLNPMLDPSKKADTLNQYFTRMVASRPKLAADKNEIQRYELVISNFNQFIGEAKPNSSSTFILKRFQEGQMAAADALSALEQQAKDLEAEDASHATSGLNARAYAILRLVEGLEDDGDAITMKAFAERVDGLYSGDDTAPKGWQTRDQLKKELRQQVRLIAHELKLKSFKEISVPVEEYATRNYAKFQ
ncbi:hypothetical protein OVA03_00540 [Asticcacaulis sp. SL142]|uniref:DUF6538 domain-containing protein n=1 Tax=Asticcacaulis sp. SL142 TaxID=2995155 RepID=UPI00226CA15B|nr:DUF6538 domain-containing protein [Asticcacaulis sp. SL142]WAC48455.1 hypothetical protein OVA03_00540 [Asticcacaulis sp. SL142]